MRHKHLPQKPGIYQIVNTASGKIYVGSACDLRKRAQIHTSYLSLGRHHNRGLQAAWKKYGSEALQVHILELVDDKEKLIEREQFWIDTLDAHKKGYNCAPTAGSQLGWKMTPEQLAEHKRKRTKPTLGFITPEGARVDILNVPMFCKQMGFSQSMVSALKCGTIRQCKGWSHVNANTDIPPRAKTYEGFVDPDGNPVHPIYNLEQFARGRGLDPSALNALSRGKIRHHKGWTHRNGLKGKPSTNAKWRRYHGFINPQGEQQPIKNLTRFCKENQLDHATMYKVMQGKKYYKQHKGWTYDPSLEKQDYSSTT